MTVTSARPYGSNRAAKQVISLLLSGTRSWAAVNSRNGKRSKTVPARTHRSLHSPDNECFRWQMAHLHSAPSGEIVNTERSLLPPAVDCIFTDGTTSLIRVEPLGLSCCLTVFLICCAALRLLEAPTLLRSHEPQ
ncbi:hypothetical protein OG301_04680 [Streptomyces platensis]|uniref:hypothetical protein n=1 Tax=Streptomyces platensis TaxID=58346 RepID=UPI002ED05B00|nr:hypothetical protein OG301_04680 [Streptomyces platensis]